LRKINRVLGQVIFFLSLSIFDKKSVPYFVRITCPEKSPKKSDSGRINQNKKIAFSNCKLLLEVLKDAIKSADYLLVDTNY
jgi:hypothetical protein